MVFDRIQELQRQSTTGDDRFTKTFPYFFGLRVPASVSPTITDFLFPLVIPPESISMDEPFTQQVTPTANAGLFVEENGIIMRPIRISGTTGWKPRLAQLPLVPPGTGTVKRSFARHIGQDPTLEALSGQRHMIFLQDRLFRAYADLKRDPNTARETMMTWHNVKDDEHFRVIPQSFKLNRDKSRRNLYHYDIQLLAVDIANAAAGLPENVSFLAQLKDGIQQVKDAISLITSVVNDLTGVIQEVKNQIQSIGNIVTSLTTLVEACRNFVNGTAAFIRAPFGSVAHVFDDLKNALSQMTDAATDVGGALVAVYSPIVIELLRVAQDGLMKIGLFPEFFSEPIDTSISRSVGVGSSSNALRTAAAELPPDSLQKLQDIGTALLPGDLTRASVAARRREIFTRYNSVFPFELGQGDSLENLASRFLGNAKRWRDIAIVNNLRPPYIVDGTFIPGTLTQGQQILIPSPARAQKEIATAGILGVSPNAPVEERLFGSDFELVRAGPNGAFFDWEVDTEYGTTDLKRVVGRPNLEQALLTRTTYEQGTVATFRLLGVQRVLGTGVSAVDLEMLRLRYSQAVLADPRIVAVRDVTLVSELDVVNLNMSAEVRGFSENQPIQVPVG